MVLMAGYNRLDDVANSVATSVVQGGAGSQVVVEGVALLAGELCFRDQAGQVLENLVAPEADHAIAVALQLGCPPSVGCGLHYVVTAVDFDCELMFWAREIDDIPPNRVLPTKPQPRK